MKKMFYSICCLCVIISCTHHSSYKTIKGKFYNRFEGYSTGIDSLIEINGYYVMQSCSLKDTTSINMIFFGDGTFAFIFLLSDLPKKRCGYEADRRKYGPYAFGAGQWGIYRIDHDTIKTQDIYEGATFVLSGGSERWYKIIDNQTLKYIHGKALENPISYSTDKYSLVKYVPLDTLPSSDCWLKEDKYFWRHAVDWEVYMERINDLRKVNKLNKL